jgi:hypothetical protein
MLLADVEPVAGALVLALGMVGGFAAAKLLPFAKAYLKGHGHPIAADLAGAIATVADEHEHGKDWLEAVGKALESPDAKELVQLMVAKKG